MPDHRDRVRSARKIDETPQIYDLKICETPQIYDLKICETPQIYDLKICETPQIYDLKIYETLQIYERFALGRGQARSYKALAVWQGCASAVSIR